MMTQKRYPGRLVSRAAAAGVLALTLLLLAFLAGPAAGEVRLDAADVGTGPYYLDAAGETYILDSDISTPGTAFVFAANGVTLDLNGFTVTFGTSTSPYRYGVVLPPAYPNHPDPVWARSDISLWQHSNNAVVRNGNIEQGAGSADSCAAVLVYDRTGITVENNSITVSGDDTFAIRINECTDVQVYLNTITDNTQVITNRHQGRAAIDVRNAHDGPIAVFNNTISNCRQWGIRVTRRAASDYAQIFNNTISPNSIVTNGYAIGVHGDKLDVFGNNIDAINGRGIHIDHCDGARVHDNNIAVIELPSPVETRTAAHGIKLELCTNAEIYSNTVLSEGLADAVNHLGNGAALSLHLEAGSNNYIHHNTFVSRHLGGPVFDPTSPIQYASAVEILYVNDPGGLRIEDNVFRSNNRLFFNVGPWAGGDGTDSVDVSHVRFARNTWEHDGPDLGIYGQDIYMGNTSVYGLTFIDPVFGPGVGFDQFTTGWNWMFNSWSVHWTLTARVETEAGDPQPGILVEARNQAGDLVLSGTTDDQGEVQLPLTDYRISVRGVGPEYLDVFQGNPYTVNAFLSSGTQSRVVTLNAPTTLFFSETGGSGAALPPAPDDVDWSFQVLASSPAPGTIQVPRKAGIKILLNDAVGSSAVSGGVLTVVGSNSGPIPGSIVLEKGGREINFVPHGRFAVNDIVTVRLEGTLTSLSGRKLDGNQDGFGVGTASDSYQYKFAVAFAPEPEFEPRPSDDEDGLPLPEDGGN